MSLGSSRVYGLDILRASAILLVLLTHGIYYFTDSWDIFFLIKYIPDGVSIFFVLSGFLIGNILIKTANKTNLTFHDLKNFWIRRWFRTLPAYYLVLSLLIGSTWLMTNVKKPLWEYLKYFLFLQAFNSGNCRLYMESWSLCVEEFFYFVIPACLFILIKCTSISAKRILSFSIVFVIVSVTAFTIYKINANHYSKIEEWDMFIRKTVFTRINSIMYGFLGAYLKVYHYQIWKYKTFFFLTGLALFAFLSVRPVFGIGPFFNYEQLSLESIAALLVIPKLSAVAQGKGLIFNFLTFISTISYSIYLINFTPYYLLQTAISSFFDIHSASLAPVRLGLFLTWSIGGGYLIYRFVEKPMMIRRESFSEKEHGDMIFNYLK